LTQEIKRLPNWQSELSDYISSVEYMPFRWGKNDCVTFAANAVRAMTGVDPIEGYRDYSTEAESKIVTARAGYRNHVDGVKEKFKKIPVALAMPGDIAVLEKHSLGIVQGMSVFRPGPEGVVLSPLSDVKAVYRVEF
jgi:hypothetical protein